MRRIAFALTLLLAAMLVVFAALPAAAATTVEVMIRLIDSAGQPVKGGEVREGVGGWPVIGHTDDEGKLIYVGNPGANMRFRVAAPNHGGTETSDYQVLAAGIVFTFQTARAEIQLEDSQGSLVDGGRVQIGFGGWPTIGHTGVNGTGTVYHELFPGSYNFRMTAPNNGGTQTKGQDIATPVVFQTSQAVIELRDHQGNPLDGGTVRIGFGGWPVIGTTGGAASGTVHHELFDGTYNFQMTYNHGTETKAADILSIDSTLVVFQTGLVDLRFSGGISHGVGGWPAYTGPTEMLPIEHRFVVSAPGLSRQEFWLTPIAGTTTTKTILVARLNSSQGAGVAGGQARLGVGGWPVIGTTNSEGILVHVRDGVLSGNMRVRMTAPNNGGTQTSPAQNLSTNSVFVFQTARAEIQLKDSQGNLVNGGRVRIGFGGWPTIGYTGDNGTGTVYHELFPGSYNFRMTAPNNGGTQTKGQDIATPVIFQTSQAVIELRDHQSNLLDGGRVRIGFGGWPVIGTTGDDGPGIVHHEVFAGSYNFRMTYNYGTETINQNIATPVVFRTGLVSLQFSGTINHGVGGWPLYTGPTEMLPVEHRFRFTGCGQREELRLTPPAGQVFAKSIAFISVIDSGGNGLASADLKYRVGWGAYTDLGTTDASGLVVAALGGALTDTKFTVTYAGGSLEKQQNIAASSCVAFQTVPVTSQLLASDSTDLSGSAAFEYRYGWGSYQPLASPTELLPINTKVRVSYLGASVEKEQSAAASPHFAFQTVPVTAALLASDGTTDLSGSATFDYRYGWGSYQSLAGPTELLPVNTKVRVTYSGASVEKEQNVAASAHFGFQTVAVTAKLLASDGATDLSADAVFEYRYGWGAHSAFTSPVELLPVNTKVRVTYAGSSAEVEQNVGVNADFVFQTGSVTSASGTCTEYRYGWGSYYVFTQGMELLPGATKFSFSDGTPETTYTISPGVNNQIR